MRCTPSGTIEDHEHRVTAEHQSCASRAGGVMADAPSGCPGPWLGGRMPRDEASPARNPWSARSPPRSWSGHLSGRGGPCGRVRQGCGCEDERSRQGRPRWPANRSAVELRPAGLPAGARQGAETPQRRERPAVQRPRRPAPKQAPAPAAAGGPVGRGEYRLGQPYPLLRAGGDAARTALPQAAERLKGCPPG